MPQFIVYSWLTLYIGNALSATKNNFAAASAGVMIEYAIIAVTQPSAYKARAAAHVAGIY